MNRILLAGLSGLLFFVPCCARAADPADEDLPKKIFKLLEELQRPDAPVEARRAAVNQLEVMTANFYTIVHGLKKGLADPDEQVRLKAAKAFQGLGPLADFAIPDLIGVTLKDSSEDVRVEAVHALALVASGQGVQGRLGIGPLMGKAVLTVAEALKDKSRKVRLRAANVLGMFGPDGKPAVPALVEALKEKDPPGADNSAAFRVSLAAAHSLNRIGPEGRVAIPALLDLVKNSDDKWLRVYAIAALGGIGDQDERVVPTLLAAVENPDLRAAAAVNLGRMGPNRAKEIVPALLKALDVSDIKDKTSAEWTQIGALRSLETMGPAAEAAVPKIEAILKDPATGSEARWAAEQALKKLRP